MARHRRRRRYGDPVIAMPSFGALKDLNPLAAGMKGSDVMIGAGIGIVGGGVVNYALNQFSASLPSVITQYQQPISTILAGLLAAAFLAKKSPQQADAYLAGALIVGVAPPIQSQLHSSFPQYFGDPVQMTRSYQGMLVPSPRHTALSGLLTASPRVPMTTVPAARRMMGY